MAGCTRSMAGLWRSVRNRVDSASLRQRRRARALAFQTLYEADLCGHRPADVLDRLASQLHTSAASMAYARELITGVLLNREAIDARIVRFAPAWPIDQMSAVDRNLLRVGLFEAVYNSSTIPVAVAINEAVELAKLYGSEGSSRLINGVLGSVVAEEAGSFPGVRPGGDPLQQEDSAGQ